MPLRILIVPDKFKGTLFAAEAAKAIGRGWRRARPQDELELLPMSDGGDGFGEVMSKLLGARVQKVRTVDAAGRPCISRWWWQRDSQTAIIESAEVIGLAMLPARRFHPFELDTFGLGAVLKAAAAKRPKLCLLGIGGSATNDSGFGVARSLGWQFLDRRGDEIRQWTQLSKLSSLRAPRRGVRFRKLLVAVDVCNPLLGSRGATRVYGPQKGLRPEDFERAERCLRRLARIVRQDLGPDLAGSAGAGAAGGLGFGLQAFLGAQAVAGFELFARWSELDRRLRASDCVITAEGAIDRSTMMGKGVSQVARRCRKFRRPCIALAGILASSPVELRVFSRAYALTQLTTLENAKASPALWLERLAEGVAGSWGAASRVRRR